MLHVDTVYQPAVGGKQIAIWFARLTSKHCVSRTRIYTDYEPDW